MMMQFRGQRLADGEGVSFGRAEQVDRPRPIGQVRQLLDAPIAGSRRRSGPLDIDTLAAAACHPARVERSSSRLSR